jgi:hypothetical protein
MEPLLAKKKRKEKKKVEVQDDGVTSMPAGHLD